MDATPKLNAALKAAQAAMTPVEKGALNPAFKDAKVAAKAEGTRYADLEDIVTATKPHLVANGIAVTQEPMEAPEGWVKLRTVLLHESGEERSGVLSLPCVNKTPQAYGSALSYAKRYSYQAMAGAVAKGEDDDGNASSGKTETTTRRAAPANKPTPVAMPRGESGRVPTFAANTSTQMSADAAAALGDAADEVMKEIAALRMAAKMATAPGQIDALRPRYSALQKVMDAKGWESLGAEFKDRKAELSKAGAA